MGKRKEEPQHILTHVSHFKWKLTWNDPRQSSCLENPVDREVWWATVYGVTKSGISPSPPLPVLLLPWMIASPGATCTCGAPWWVSEHTNCRLAKLCGLRNAYNEGDVVLIPELWRSPGGRHGNPLQYSCWENRMDRGAWRATIHRVAKNRMLLKCLRMSNDVYILLLHLFHFLSEDILWIYCWNSQ